jgi:hypothetical protein
MSPKKLLGVVAVYGVAMGIAFALWRQDVKREKLVADIAWCVMVSQFLTEDELAEIRRRNQDHMAQAKMGGTVDSGALRIPEEFIDDIGRRALSTSPQTMADLSLWSKREAMSAFPRNSPPEAEDIGRLLRTALIMHYTEEEVTLITQSPRCRAAVVAGNIPTSLEVIQWTQQEEMEGAK